MERKIELKNIEIGEYCMLNILTGGKLFYKQSYIKEFTGLYFKDEKTFFALYPTENGPIMYYKGKEYPLKKNLHIKLKKWMSGESFALRNMEYESNITLLHI